tara:strand:+ start:318 stop:959 length:642 start_codon:yes stop_codon:yes gene_type:complete
MAPWAPAANILLDVRMKEEAQRMADAMGDGKGRRGSILEGGGDLLGCLGELAFKQMLQDSVYGEHGYGGGPLKIKHQTQDHPELKSPFDLDVQGIKIDVKSKWSKGMPKYDWEGSVAMGREDDSDLPQDVDVFAFMRILYNEKEMIGKTKVPGMVGYFCGWLPKDQFYKRAVGIKKGEVDQRPTNYNKFKSHKSQWNIYHHQLIPSLGELLFP